MKSGIGKFMQQAQDMQERMAKAQQELANLVVTGTAGGDLVTVEMTGRHDARKVTLDPSLVSKLSAEEKEMLEDLLAAAVNDATKKIETESRERLQNLTSGIDIPDDLNFPGDGD